jgi:signal transduction histidine kinase/CheY-like chemotaxis protein
MKRHLFHSVSGRLLVLVLISAVLPLGAAAVVLSYTAGSQTEEDALLLLETHARQLSGTLDELHRKQRQRARQLSGIGAVVSFLTSPAADRPSLEDWVRSALEEHTAHEPGLHHVALLDSDDQVVFSTRRTRGGASVPGDQWESTQDEVAISSVFFIQTENGASPVIAYVTPVRTARGERVGSLALFLSAQRLWETVHAGNELAGAGSFSILLDSRGIRIAHSTRDDLVFRPTVPLNPDLHEALVAERSFGSRTQELLHKPVPLPKREARWRERGERIYAAANEVWNLSATRQLDTVPWTLIYNVPETSLLAPVRRLVIHAVLASLGLIGFALFAGWKLSRRLVHPLESLSSAAERFGRGELGIRVAASTRDELGILARAFNLMATRLESNREELERAVHERTQELERANAELNRGNRALAEKSAELARREAHAIAWGRTLAALAGEGPFSEVLEAALREVMGAIGGVVAVCYRRTEESCFVPLASVGAVAQGAQLRGGLAVEALRTGRTVLVSPVPEEAELRFDAVLVAGLPKVLLLTPLRAGERNIGLLAVGLLAPPTEGSRLLLEEVSVPLALSIHRYELAERQELLLEELGKQNHELQAQAEELRLQGEELSLQQRQLEAKNQEVEQANQLKSEFIANMSHELRTPLNTVIGFSELLLDTAHESLSARQRRYIEDIRMSGRHLLGLINAILDLAKIEAGHMTLALEELPASIGLHEVHTLVEPLAHRKQISLHLVGDERLRVHADPGKLRQILLNLASNAVKFSPAGSSVELGVRAEGRLAVFWVKDEGAGIEEEFLPLLFRPFIQGEDPLVKAHDGTGLGLAISRRLVDLHGGTISVETARGRGSTFSFTIPLANTNELAKPPVALLALRPPVEKTERGGQARILVIDDDPAVGSILRSVLEPEGHQLTFVETGREGLERAIRERPDLALVDLTLPDVSGFELMERLAEDERTKELPLIVLTARSVTAQERERLVPQVRALAEKGNFTREELLTAVERARTPRSTAPRAGAPLVLVVDDHDLNRELCRMLLERQGYDVAEAHNGEEAVQLAHQLKPALILMDLSMPRKDGFVAARELREHPATAAIPLVALTARAMRSDEMRARQEGFSGYVTKPIDPAVLTSCLTELLGVRRAG